MGAPIAVQEVRIPITYTVTVVLADSEYSQQLPLGAKRFTIQARTAAVVRFAFETGHAGASVAPFNTLKIGAPFTERDIFSSSTIFLASSVAGTVVEIVCWV